MSELMQLESAMSTSRYLPPIGTAGFDRCCVSGKRRLPAPPPRMTAKRFEFAGMGVNVPVKGRPFWGGVFAGLFPFGLYADTRADACGPGFNHLARVVEIFHAA